MATPSPTSKPKAPKHKTHSAAVKHSFGKDRPKNPVAVLFAEKSEAHARSRAVTPFIQKSLTEKQATFVKLWAQGETIMSAAHRAGYTDNGSMAYAMVNDPTIRAMYDAEKKAWEESCAMTRKEVLDGFIDAANMAKLMGEPASMVSAYREIGKMCGFYEPLRVKLENGGPGQQLLERLERLNDDELLKLMYAPDPAAQNA